MEEPMITTKEQKRAAEEISNSSNVIGKGTVLEGNIETHGNMRIEGKIIGNVRSRSKIALGSTSHVEGNIAAQNADIEGEGRGRVEVAEMLVLKATAIIHGDILTGKLVVEPGAVFNGSCKMGAAIKDIKLGENGNRAYRTEEARAI
jgi:cytoskeletal protein CcmA (bactofilin family)